MAQLVVGDDCVADCKQIASLLVLAYCADGQPADSDNDDATDVFGVVVRAGIVDNEMRFVVDSGDSGGGGGG